MNENPHFQYLPPRIAKTLTIPETTLYDNLEITTKKYPNKNAIHYYGTSLTYQELLNQVNLLSGYLQQTLKINKGENVLLFMQNSPQYLISFFAILRIRATVIPINPMSTSKEMKYYIEDSNAKHAIVGQELYGKISGLVNDEALQNVIVATYSDYIDEGNCINEPSDLVKEKRQHFPDTIAWQEALSAKIMPTNYQGKVSDVAIIPYTSGTTGVPKGCIHTNKTAQANTVGASRWMNMTADAVTLTTLPLFHVTGLIHSGLTPIFAGSTIVLLTRWDREYAIKAIEHYKCTHWINISTMLIDFLANPDLQQYDISSLQLIGGGGAPLPKVIGEKLIEISGLEYVEGYGLSETMSHTHFNPPQRAKLQCLGIPAFDVDARIIDLKTNKELKTGEEGELIVSGPQLFKGYYNKQQETTNSFIQIDNKSFFKTGDIVKKDEEGYFYLVDRIKRMINANGFRYGGEKQ